MLVTWLRVMYVPGPAPRTARTTTARTCASSTECRVTHPSSTSPVPPVGRCRLTVSKHVLKAPLVSAWRVVKVEPCVESAYGFSALSYHMMKRFEVLLSIQLAPLHSGVMGSAYEGGRDFGALSAFAKESLGPSCGAENIDLCDDEQKAGWLLRTSSRLMLFRAGLRVCPLELAEGDCQCSPCEVRWDSLSVGSQTVDCTFIDELSPRGYIRIHPEGKSCSDIDSSAYYQRHSE